MSIWSSIKEYFAPKIVINKSITGGELRSIILNNLQGKLLNEYMLRIADTRYYLMKREYIWKFIDDCRNGKYDLATFKYRKEKFDCDDFAFALKADFSYIAYDDSSVDASYALGIIWGELTIGSHAMNFFIDEDKKLWLIEPQNGNTRELANTDIDVDLVLI